MRNRVRRALIVGLLWSRGGRVAAVAGVGLGLLVCGGPASSAVPPDNVLKIEFTTDIDYVDPALSYFSLSWQIEYATCAKLLNYPDRPAPEGARLQPEIASGLPLVSPDGKTYEFDLRHDYTFSPPSGLQVTADHFKWTFDRILSPIMASPAQPFFRDIVGAEEVINGTASTVSGVVAVDADTLRITQISPDHRRPPFPSPARTM